MISVQKEPYIWLILLTTIKWISTSLYLIHFHSNFFAQILAELDLNDNDIKDQGVEYLAKAFRKSKVDHFLSLSFCFTSFISQKALTTLTLAGNKIEDQGIQCLANAFQNTTVSEFQYSGYLLISFGLSGRHLLSWILHVIKLEIQGWNIWQMVSETTGWMSTPFFRHFHYYLLSQTLATLKLNKNKITADGTKHLADLFRNNTVNLNLPYSFSSPS